MYSGHIPSDPAEASAAPLDVTAHLFFYMVKARRTADKERIMFWFNVSVLYFMRSRSQGSLNECSFRVDRVVPLSMV